LMTLTRQIRQHRGEAVVAHPSREMEEFLEMMQMEDYWDVFPSVEEAKGFFHRGSNDRP
jgi:anti-sigma B factor antagonist